MTIPGLDTPFHLAPLTEGTPLSLEKLKAAWPGLSFAEKITVLRILLGDPTSKKDGGVLHWKRHRNLVKALGLADENEYIRDLTSLKVSKDDKDEESAAIYWRVMNDAAGLVLSSQDYWAPSLFAKDTEKNFKHFWALPVSRRLALVGTMEDEEIARRVKYGANELLPTGAISSGDLEDVVHEYRESRDTSRIKHFDDAFNCFSVSQQPGNKRGWRQFPSPLDDDGRGLSLMGEC